MPRPAGRKELCSECGTVREVSMVWVRPGADESMRWWQALILTPAALWTVDCRQEAVAQERRVVCVRGQRGDGKRGRFRICF